VYNCTVNILESGTELIAGGTYRHRVLKESGDELIVGGALAVGLLHQLRSVLHASRQPAVLVVSSVLLQYNCMPQRLQYSLLRQPDPQFPLYPPCTALLSLLQR
jgi:hypothetical protein